jgi:RND family efflux transporter MFP subunit
MPINRSYPSALAAAGALAAAALAAACSTPNASASTAAAAPEPIAIATAVVESQPIDRYLRVTGSLVADEQAEVSAEVSGRVIATPVERGTRIAEGAALATISTTQASAQLAEADANAAQIEARLGLGPGQAFDPLRVPDVMSAKAALDLAAAEFSRIQSLLEQNVVSQSEYDQRRMQVEAARQQYRTAQNAAEQSLRALDAARARVALARKAMADTTVRAPFAGLVAERLVSVGDYVSAGTRVATVVRIDPVRVELTVPEHAVSLIKDGQPVRLTVDAYPGEEFVARLRHISPALRADQRALTVEAIAANADGRLKPGLFATAAIQLPAGAPALLVPATAIETVSGTSRVYVKVNGGTVEERIVAIGETVGPRVEVTSGLSSGEVVAAEPKGRLADGVAVRAR